MIKNRKILILTVIALILLSGAGYFGYTVYAQTDQPPGEAETIQTAVARRGDLVIFASAAGEVVPSTELSLGFDEGGTIIEILVRVGDKVEAGQILARLQTDETEETLAVDLADADLAVLTARQELDEIYANHPIEAAQALVAVEEARIALDGLNDPQARIAAATVALIDAQEALEEAENDRVKLDYARAGELSIEAAYVEFLFAEEAYNQALKDFNLVAHKDLKNPDRVLALQRLIAAEAEMKSAQATYNYLALPAASSEMTAADAALAQAQAALETAQHAYDQALAGPTPGEIAMAEATLIAAQAAYDRIKDGPDALEIAIAEAKLNSAEADLALAQEKDAVIELTAPVAATVSVIDGGAGETVGTAALITLVNLANPLLEVYLDETDLASVALGYDVEVVFDAFPDDLFHGVVIEVSPVLENVGGVAAVRTLVQLTDYDRTTSLPAGLSAGVDVIGGRAIDAVLIPVEALNEIGPGEYSVFVMENGEPVIRFVEVGIQDFTSAEILSGLEAGEIITTGIVETGQ